MAAAALNTHPLLHLMVQPHVSHPFIYTCPAACRHLRRGGFGRCPAAEEEQLLEQAAEDAADEQEAEGDSDGWDEEDGSSRGLLNTSSLAAAAGRARGSGTGRQPAANRRKAAAAATGAAAAAQGASGGGRGRGHGGRGGRGKVGAKKRGGRGKASAQEQIQQVEQQLGGLSLHNSKGRVKYYHSLTCVALTQQELFELGGGDPESKADVAEWQVGACTMPLRCGLMVCRSACAGCCVCGVAGVWLFGAGVWLPSLILAPTAVRLMPCPAIKRSPCHPLYRLPLAAEQVPGAAAGAGQPVPGRAPLHV